MIYQGMHIENYTDSEIIDEGLKSADILTQNIAQRYMDDKTLDHEDNESLEILEYENDELLLDMPVENNDLNEVVS